MSQPRVLLVDLRQQRDAPSVYEVLKRQCCVERVAADTDDLANAIADFAPHTLLFDYDYPNIPTLVALKETKIFHPSIPIILVTEQHSEALAVWALRTRVWDYFVKPLQEEDLFHCLELLSQLPSRSAKRGPRQMIQRPCAIPQEARFRGSAHARPDCRVDPARQYIESNLGKKIAQSMVAELCGMSPSEFSRCFRKVYGLTFQEYLIQRRVQEAIKLLKNPSASITDVCYTVGFGDQSYFTRTFRRYVGTAPSAYRRQLDEVDASLRTAAV
jgi:AraC-like DNA-binding protein/ActR/RegA family two-component response regulator